ncbi:MAG TPA: hypothetical protein VHL59_02260 [Thermoanaerobaculia bacterium]|nr:hypothetical protein [Thermoanaerobaculia bacterium]
MNRHVRHEVTPLTYFTDIVAMSMRHGGELALAMICVAIAALIALLVRSLLHLPALNNAQVLLLLLPLAAAAMLFVTAVAAWRLHRRQDIALADARSLLADLERDLRE